MGIMMKKWLFIILLLALSTIKPAFSADLIDINYEQIYNNLAITEISFIGNEDPDESYDYSQYFLSPYPLIRTTSTLKFKTFTIKPGYYLLKPLNMNGNDVVMFKQRGKITAIVPIFEKHLIDPIVIYKIPPKPKVPLWKKPFVNLKEGFDTGFGRYKKPIPIPKCALDSFASNDGKYFVIWLYQEDYVYKMVFQIVR